MTHLSFLSKSVSADMHLNHKIQKVVAIPTSTKIAIIEDESEEDAESDSEEEVNDVQADCRSSSECPFRSSRHHCPF